MREMGTGARMKIGAENFANGRECDGIGVVARYRARLQREIDVLRRYDRIDFPFAARDFPWRAPRNCTPAQTPPQWHGITKAISEPLAKSKWRRGNPSGTRVGDV
jgi:hypothetical protein